MLPITQNTQFDTQSVTGLTAATPQIFPTDASELASVHKLGHNASSLLFVDSGVQDYQSLLATSEPGTEVHILNSAQNAVAQITQTLLGRKGIDSIHIVSHGSAGSIQLGNDKLDRYNLKSYASSIRSWGQALTQDADILLYGCNVAENVTGKTFVQSLSELTGADVAASDNLTGSSVLGDDWTLEYHTGTIETTEISANNYVGTLGSVAVVNGKLAISDPSVLYPNAKSETNALTLSLINNGKDLLVRDANNNFTAMSGVTQVNGDPRAVMVSLSSLSGIAIDLGADKDTVLFDQTFSNGAVTLPNLTIDMGSDDDAVTFSGGTLTTPNLTISLGNGDDSITFDESGLTTYNLNIDGSIGNDRVTFASNISLLGSNLQVNAETITVNNGVIVSTRNMSGTNPVEGSSAFDSGNISFSGKTITIGKDASLLSHVEPGSVKRAGNINLSVDSVATSARDYIEQAINGLGLGVEWH